MFFDADENRTLRPTQRRRREVRARGEVARSTTLVAAGVLLSTSVALWWLGPALTRELGQVMKSNLSAAPVSLDQGPVTVPLTQLLTRVSHVLLPILLVIMAAAVAFNLVQSGWLWSPARLTPQWDRLDPARALGQWCKGSSWLEGIGSLVRLALLASALAIYLRTRMTSAGALSQGSPQTMLSLSARLIGELAVVLSLALFVLAIIDYGYRFWQHERRLMMTPEEVRREQREDEADPRWKHRQRELAATNVALPQAGGVDEIRSV